MTNKNYHDMKKLLAIFLISHGLMAQSISPDLQNPELWRLQDRHLTNTENGGVRLDVPNPDDGLLVLKDYDFKNGTIELDVKGQDKPGASFVGIAFNIQNEEVFETFYLRPFNFKNEARKTHSMQYTFSPVYDWRVLRENFPGKYENELIPAPDPNAWQHVKLLIQNGFIKAYVNHAKQPNLMVESLNEIGHGCIGLWTGSGSIAEFKNLKITPEK
ncbi:MAG: hypothetical protein ACI9IP_002250 [Arcticibacterium sp.]|jgi:hypothetical protein